MAKNKQQAETKDIVVTWTDGFKYRLKEGEHIVLAIADTKRTDYRTVYKLNAKNEVDCRYFWQPDDVEYFVGTGQAPRNGVSLESFAGMVTNINQVLATGQQQAAN